MKLKSEICTSVEQSNKLLELGLKPETADMHYHKDRLETSLLRTKENSAVYKGMVRIDGKQYADEYFERQYGQDIPAWSLSRLIELMPTEISEKKTGVSYDLYILPDGNEINYSIAGRYKVLHSVCIDGPEATLFDAIIEMMEWPIGNNHSNKDWAYTMSDCVP